EHGAIRSRKDRQRLLQYLLRREMPIFATKLRLVHEPIPNCSLCFLHKDFYSFIEWAVGRQYGMNRAYASDRCLHHCEENVAHLSGVGGLTRDLREQQEALPIALDIDLYSRHG